MSSISESSAAGQKLLQSGVLKYVEPIAAPPAIPAPIAAYPAAPSQYLRAPLPDDFWQQPDAQRQFHAAAIPQTRISPLPDNTSPVAGAQAASQAIQIVQSTPATTTTSGVTSVGLTAPSVLFSTPVPGSPVTSAGVLSLVLLDEPQNFVFAGPANTAGTIALDAALGTVTAQSAGTSQSIAASGVSTQANDFALLAIGWQDGNYSSSVNPDASWTNIFGFPTSNVGEGVWWKSVPSAGAVSATASVTTTGNPALAATIVTAKTSGGTPAIRQSAQQVNTGFAGVGVTSTLAYSSNVLLGSMLFLVTIEYSKFSPWVVTDSKGNTWVQISSTSISVPNGGFPNNVRTQTVWATPSGSAGANTLTFASTFPTAISGSFYIFEVTNLAAPVQTPIFRALTPSDIPGMSTGLMSPQFGGTGANLITTGGTNQVVQQTSAGGAFTVGQLDFPNLSGTGKISKYNNINTVSNGVPSEYATVDLTAQAAAIGTTTIYTPTVTGMFRLSAYLKVTTVDATSSTLGSVTITYTDGTDSVVQSAVMQMADENGASATSNTGNTTAAKLIGSMNIWALTGVAIRYAVAYASNIAGTMKYEVHLKAEAL